uniref:Uncharacterized protein n=1 Tax=Anguilla anguilla TaxID=7936 RepID=A0A0E9PTW4_ANGAN
MNPVQLIHTYSHFHFCSVVCRKASTSNIHGQTVQDSAWQKKSNRENAGTESISTHVEKNSML